MKSILLLNRALQLVVLLIITGCANSDSLDKMDSQSLTNLKHDLSLGKIVIIYQMNNNDKISEQYADWSANLNDFMRENAKQYVAYKTTTKINSALKLSNIKLEKSYTLFVKKGKPSFFYDGVIVESMVYISIDEAYTKDKLSPMAEAFLPEKIKFQF